MHAVVKNEQLHSWIKAILAIAIIFALFFVESSFAASSGNCDSSSGNTKDAIGGVAENITNSFGALVKLITAGAFVAGFGFVLGAIFKFKAHKDNPTQIPIGTPIALLFIGAAMIFLPQILTMTGSTLFSTQAQKGGVEGVCDFGFGSTTASSSG